jgi:hypothetical protein
MVRNAGAVRMQIVTVCFDYPDAPCFATLLEVFRHSVKRLMPDVEYIEYRPKPPKRERTREAGYLVNTFKLDVWASHMEAATKKVIFIDCDMLALRNAAHAFDQDFDIAYTYCPKGYMVPLNGGVIMARPNERSRAFFRKLKQVNDAMFYDPAFHKPWQDKYHGMNQSALGCMLENYCHGINIAGLPTVEWNAIECDWPKINDNTVFLHINKGLRRILVKGQPVARVARAMDLWHAEKALMEAGL